MHGGLICFVRKFYSAEKNTLTNEPVFLGISKGGCFMTSQQEKLINSYRREGLGYKKIATLLDLPANTVKTYIRRHPLENEPSYCLQCGVPIKQLPHTREKKFCSDSCRLTWWHEHPNQLNRTTTEFVCGHCGRTFSTHKKAQRFCSRHCYGDSMRKEATV